MASEDDLAISSYYISITDHLPSDVCRSLNLIKNLSGTTYPLPRSFTVLADAFPADQGVTNSNNNNDAALVTRISHPEALAVATRLLQQIKFHKAKLAAEIARLEASVPASPEDSLITPTPEPADHYNNLRQQPAGLNPRSRPRPRRLLTPTHSSPPLLRRSTRLEIQQPSPPPPSPPLPPLPPPPPPAARSPTPPPRQLRKSTRQSQTNPETYCICNDEAHGQMIACDNPDCSIEWYHLDCLNMKRPPKGKWLCPQCSHNRKRKR
ncbi:hypothetical protein V1514DRAFT_323486 [Lipomyces japonicus]|uniref:uncharacterized protein n=1 Tax=Lipomyces japonicus TaxID=56871 RepID=UPI0034CFA15E